MPNIYKINITLDDLVLAQASFALTPAMDNTEYLLRM